MNNTIVEVNIGGQLYTTTTSTLTKYPDSVLARSVTAFLNLKSENLSNHLIPIEKDDNARLFIDRDGAIFRYILDYLRRNAHSKEWIKQMIPTFDLFRLRKEAEFYGLTELVSEIDTRQDSDRHKTRFGGLDVENNQTAKQNAINKAMSKCGPLSGKGPYYISIGCRGYYSAERDNPANDMTKFRKITRIIVSGRSDVAKEVFGDELNESRDPERFPPYGYTCRYYLTHTYLEYAFETLAKKGFELVTSFSTGNQTLPSSNKDEFKQWSTYVEYLFYKRANNTV